MKILLILLVLGALIIGGAFLFKSNSETSSGVDDVYILAVLEPSVLVKSEGQAEFMEISKSLQVKAGDEIKTSLNGRASLLYPNGNITNLDHDSHLKIKSLEESGDKSVLTLLAGGVLAKVRKVLGTGDYYKIETQNSVASVRGTIFAVKFKENKSSILVLENKVLVSALSPETGEILPEGIVEVDSGKKVKIDSEHLPNKDYPLEAQLLTKEDISEEFMEENLDEEDLKDARVKEVFEKVERPLPSVKPSLRFEDFVPEKDKEDQRGEIELKETEVENVWEIPEDQKVEERELIEEIKFTPTPLSTKTPTPTPKPVITILSTPTPEPSREVINSGGGSVETVTTSTPIPTPTPTPVPAKLISITPKSVDISLEKQEIVLNGQKLNGVKQVLIGESRVPFFVLDESTIFATVPVGFKAGTYDVSATTSTGETLRLENILTVR